MQTIHLLPAYLLNAIKNSFHLTCNSPEGVGGAPPHTPLTGRRPANRS